MLPRSARAYQPSHATWPFFYVSDAQTCSPHFPDQVRPILEYTPQAEARAAESNQSSDAVQVTNVDGFVTLALRVCALPGLNALLKTLEHFDCVIQCHSLSSSVEWWPVVSIESNNKLVEKPIIIVHLMALSAPSDSRDFFLKSPLSTSRFSYRRLSSSQSVVRGSQSTAEVDPQRTLSGSMGMMPWFCLDRRSDLQYN